jgi:hypothetical protein
LSSCGTKISHRHFCLHLVRKFTDEALKLECLHSLTNRWEGMQQKLQMALHWWTTVTSLLRAQGCEFECILPKKCIHHHDISMCNVHWDHVFYVSNNTTQTYTVNGWNAEATWIQIWRFLQQIWVKKNTLLYFYKWKFSIIYQVIPYTENQPVLYTST